MENKHAMAVSCGARHSAVLTGMVFQMLVAERGTLPTELSTSDLAFVFSRFNETKLKSPSL